ncbi:MAG: hypothetical protein IJ087_13485 [Eggerthellaceae bacterium]|nr:hypothetical protein [Eggerthellaceae bacterium]
MKLKGIVAAATCVCLTFSLAACGTNAASSSSSSATSSSATSAASTLSSVPTKSSITTNEAIANSVGGEHAITADGTTATYSNAKVEKTGDSNSGDEADFYGDNASVFATNGATLNLNEIVLESNGMHANGVFSYGEGTTVNIADSVIETSGNCSGGLMTTGGGTMNANNLRITTSGNSSAAIRSDRGGGTVNVNGGVYTTSGTGSPVIYSTADITVSNAELASTASQGVVVEGKNSVALHDVSLVANNNTKNSDKSSFYQAVMIYQSMSGDAASGKSNFSMDGGSLTNENGDVFFVNNTACEIDLNGAAITNNGDGVFLRAAAAGWGTEGSNGGQVTLKATDQTINGDIVVDSVSNLNLHLTNSTFTGAINSDGQAGDVYVEVANGSKWTLTADSYITSLTCSADSINLNGHALYVNGVAYSEGTASTGEAIAVVASESSGGPGGTPPDGKPGENGGSAPDKPGEGNSNDSVGDNGSRPSKPSGDGSSNSGNGGTPPSKPNSGN